MLQEPATCRCSPGCGGLETGKRKTKTDGSFLTPVRLTQTGSDCVGQVRSSKLALKSRRETPLSSFEFLLCPVWDFVAGYKERDSLMLTARAVSELDFGHTNKEGSSGETRNCRTTVKEQIYSYRVKPPLSGASQEKPKLNS